MSEGRSATITKHVGGIFKEAECLRTGDPLSHNMLGAMLLVDEFGHELVPGKQGRDARDSSARLFEYKVVTERRTKARFGTPVFPFFEEKYRSRVTVRSATS